MRQNPKPASFYQNLIGNLVPGTMDTHAFRNIAMRTGDPDFLERMISEKLESPDAPLSNMQAMYGERRGDKLYYRPQKLFLTNRMSMDEAQNFPIFWASRPRPNEYAAAEDLYTQLAKARGLQPAEGQSAAWAGAAGLTGLESPPNRTATQALNNRILLAARLRGEDPEDTLKWFVRQRKPLLNWAAPFAAGAAAAGAGLGAAATRGREQNPAGQGGGT